MPIDARMRRSRCCARTPSVFAQVDLREFDADSDGVDGGEFYSDSD